MYFHAWRGKENASAKSGTSEMHTRRFSDTVASHGRAREREGEREFT